MAYTVKQLSELSKVTVRALHYYEEHTETHSKFGVNS